MMIKYTAPLHKSLPFKSVHNETVTNYDHAYQLLLQDKFPAIDNPGSVFDPGPLLTMQTIQRYTSNPNAVSFPNASTPNGAFTIQGDIKEILKTRSNKSAPGLDKIRYSHVKQFHKLHPSALTNLINACLEFQYFPLIFRVAQLSQKPMYH